MAIKKINYNGSSKVIIRLCQAVNDLIDRGSGGHTIQNSSGTDMTARTNLQFTGASVSDDAVNDRTVVDVPTYSDATQSVSGLMSASDKTKLDNIASGADAVSWTQTQASGTKIAEIDINGTSQDVFVPSGSAGHTIWNRIKTALTARGKLWFADASISDASADDATKVEVVTELASENAFDALATDGSADGIYTFPDSGTGYLNADMVGYGAGTVKTALDGLNALVATIDDTTPASAGGSKSVSFPSGFTMNNSVIVTVLVKVGNYAFSNVGSAPYIGAYYKSDGTGITLSLTNDAPSGATSKAVKIVLLKI